MGENEQGGMLRMVVVVGLVALIAAVIIGGVVGMKASMTKNTDKAVGAIAKGQQVGGRNYFIMNNAVTGYLDDAGQVNGYNGNGDMTSDFIAVSQDEKWQLTSWKAPNMTGNIIYAYYDSNKSFIAGSQSYRWWLPSIKDPITTSITIPHGVTYMRVSSQHIGGNQGAKVKVEKGTTPTDWTPAPEDQI